ncbi:MAG: DUF4115 domain-containing protein [Xanthomonadales bacterium]|nr:DUF4115 domain-containing protein [Xanthomonadales bacterium]
MSEQQALLPMGLGDRLREARERRKLSLPQAAAETRIQQSILEALEADRTDHIAPVYLKGYVRSYARFLGIPADELEADLASRAGGTPTLHPVFDSPPRRSPVDRWLKVTGYVVASLLIGTLAWQLTHEVVRISQSDGTVAARGGVDPQVTEPAPSASQPVNASMTPLEALRRRHQAAPADTARDAWAALDRVPAETIKQDPLLRLVAAADSWVEVTDAEGRQLELNLMRAGESRAYQGTPPFNVLLGRASAIEVYLGGERVDLEPWTRGDVARIPALGATDEPPAGG